MKRSRLIAILIGTFITIFGFAVQIISVWMHRPMPVYGTGLTVFSWTFLISIAYNEWASRRTRRHRPTSHTPRNVQVRPSTPQRDASDDSPCE